MRSVNLIDYFDLLGEPRRPWLDPEALKQKFLKLSADVHPDRIHNQAESKRLTAHQHYTDLNAAYQCLREPKDRLRHLLELEAGTDRVDLQRIPSDLMDLSMEIGRACQQADALLGEKAATTSPLLKAQQFQRHQEWIEGLQDLRQKLGALSNQLLAELKKIDTAWTQTTPNSPESEVLLAQLDGLCRLFGFSGRWQKQLEQRIVQLSF